MVTTIQLEEETKKRLDRMKMFPRETYNQTIARLIRESESDDVLSPETIKNIERALEDVKAGRVYSTKEIKKRHGIK